MNGDLLKLDRRIELLSTKLDRIAETEASNAEATDAAQQYRTECLRAFADTSDPAAAQDAIDKAESTLSQCLKRQHSQIASKDVLLEDRAQLVIARDQLADELTEQRRRDSMDALRVEKDILREDICSLLPRYLALNYVAGGSPISRSRLAELWSKSIDQDASRTAREIKQGWSC